MNGDDRICEDNKIGEHDVFISYSSKNKNVADAIVSDFEHHGIRCWYAPRDILPGEDSAAAIRTGLNEAKVCLLLFTDESNTSRQVMNEIALAFNVEKTIIPFKLTESEMSTEMEYYLTRVHWLDAVSEPLSDNIKRLREYTGIIVRNTHVEDVDEINAHQINTSDGNGRMFGFKESAVIVNDELLHVLSFPALVIMLISMVIDLLSIFGSLLVALEGASVTKTVLTVSDTLLSFIGSVLIFISLLILFRKETWNISYFRIAAILDLAEAFVGSLIEDRWSIINVLSIALSMLFLLYVFRSHITVAFRNVMILSAIAELIAWFYVGYDYWWAGLLLVVPTMLCIIIIWRAENVVHYPINRVRRT